MSSIIPSTVLWIFYPTFSYHVHFLRFRISYKYINIRSPLIIRNHVRVSHPLLSRMCVKGLLKEEKCRTARVI